MLLQLYPATQTEFRYNGDPIRHAFDVHVIRDDTFYLEFKVHLDPRGDYKNIQRGKIVKALDPDGMEQPFRILDIDDTDYYKKITALHVLYDLDAEVIGPINVDRTGLDSVIAGFADYLKHTPFTFDSSITDRRTFNTKADEQGQLFNALDVLLNGAHSLVGVWEAELLINGFDIRLIPSVGERTNALIYEHKNISSFENQETNQGLVTRIHAFSKFRPEREEGAEGEPEEIELSVVVDSPLINEYTIVYNRKYINNDMKTEEELKRWAGYKYSLEKLDLPRRSIKVDTNIIDGTEIGYGDYLVLRYTTHDIDEEIRCVGYDYDPIAETLYSITLGSRVQTVGESIAGNVASRVEDLTNTQIQNEVEKINERVTRVQMAANGFNRVAYGPEPVPNPRDGDLWYKFEFDTPDTISLYIYDEGMWKLIVDDFTGDRVEEKIKELETEAEKLTQSILDSEKRAEQELERIKSSIADLDDSVKQFDLEKLRAEIDSIEKTFADLNISSTTFDELRQKIEQAAETSRVNAEMIGSDGVTRYNKNILLGDTKRVVPFDDPVFTIQANDGGFKAGETYTLSFEALCELLAKSKVVFTFEKPTN